MSRMIEVREYGLHEEVRVDPARTALVVVDMQNDFVREGGSLRVPDAEATIPVISQLLALARARDARCLKPGHPPRRRSGVADLAQPGREGSWGWQIVDALAPADDETVLRKVRYDAFYGTRWITCCGSGASIRW